MKAMLLNQCWNLKDTNTPLQLTEIPEPIKPEVQEFALEEANQALMELRTRKIRGAKVLRIA